MKILVIDNTIDPDSWGSADLVQQLRVRPDATITVRRGPAGDLPRDPRAFDRIVVSGSKASCNIDEPWTTALLDFIRKSVDTRRPLLGVCFGHQMLARAMGGAASVGVAAHAEVGWSQVELVGESPLFAGLPREFHTFSSHYDEVRSLPAGLKNLAKSAACPIQAVQLEDGRPVFGIQFHPERDVAGAAKTFAGAPTELKRRGLSPDLVLLHPSPKESARLYDPTVATRIFRNFLELAP